MDREGHSGDESMNYLQTVIVQGLGYKNIQENNVYPG